MKIAQHAADSLHSTLMSLPAFDIASPLALPSFGQALSLRPLAVRRPGDAQQEDLCGRRPGCR
jgi:hypothetical protein